MQTRSALGVSTHAAIRGSFLEVGTRRSHCVVQIPRREAVVVVETLLQSMVQALRVDGTRSMRCVICCCVRMAASLSFSLQPLTPTWTGLSV